MVLIEDVTGQEENVEVRRRNIASNNDGSPESNGDEQEEESPPTELSFEEQVAQAREQYQPTPMEKFMAILKSLILRALVVYFIMSFLRGSTSTKSADTTGGGQGSTAPSSLASSNVYPNGTEFDMYVYVSEDSDPIRNFTNGLIWKQEGLMYGDWYSGELSDGTFTKTLRIPISKRVQNNGSLYLHTYLTPMGFSPDPSIRDYYSQSRTVYASKMINKFKKKKYAKTHNLLTGETTLSAEDQEKAKQMTSEIVSHWHPNVTINLVTDWTQWTMGSVPAPLNEYIKFLPSDLKYQPVVFYNEYWNMLKDYMPINTSTPVLQVHITYQPLSLFKWQLYAAQTMRNQWHSSLLTGTDDNDDDQDTLKEALLETNPILLVLTFVVSILHSIFEFLAFKNDIQFWNNRKSLEGLSVRSVFFNVFQSVIVLLYVLDNETNFVIRMSVFVGLLIEIWKINKVTDITLDRENKVLGLFPRVRLLDKKDYVESSTRQYDILAFKYLSWALFPLLLCYSVYSLLYQEHKGWYSWVLGMLYGFLLTFGFIMMTPQLFINYKLKSVAHLPWRMLSYKFLNTFIDDIFAFVIKMPTMYRIDMLDGKENKKIEQQDQQEKTPQAALTEAQKDVVAGGTKSKSEKKSKKRDLTPPGLKNENTTTKANENDSKSNDTTNHLNTDTAAKKSKNKSKKEKKDQ